MPGTLTAAAVALLVSHAAAYPSLTLSLIDKRQDLARGVWQAPGPTDDRTACPGLNTMANHGFINRNGRNITKQAMQQGFLDAFGMGFDATDAGGTNSINLCAQLLGVPCDTIGFSLNQLNTPHAIEHDGSLSREDAEMAYNIAADNHSFNQTIWDMTLNVWSVGTHINASMANTARITRIAQAKAMDAPNWFIENDGGSGAEHGFTLTTMNDPLVGDVNTNPQARLDWVNFWFSNERLPTELGWVAPTPAINNAQVGACANSVFNAPTYVPPPPPPKTTSTSSVITRSSSIIPPSVTVTTTSEVASTFLSVVPSSTVSINVATTISTFTGVTTTTSTDGPSTFTVGTGTAPVTTQPSPPVVPTSSTPVDTSSAPPPVVSSSAPPPVVSSSAPPPVASSSAPPPVVSSSVPPPVASSSIPPTSAIPPPSYPTTSSTATAIPPPPYPATTSATPSTAIPKPSPWSWPSMAKPSPTKAPTVVPKCPNPYAESLSPEEWGSWGEKAQGWVRHSRDQSPSWMGYWKGSGGWSRYGAK